MIIFIQIHLTWDILFAAQIRANVKKLKKKVLERSVRLNTRLP